MKSGQFDVQSSELECSLENASKLVLVLDQVVENVAEQAIEDVESSVNLSLDFTLDELEEQIEKVLPDGCVFLVLHRALNLDGDIANFVHKGLVCSVDLAERLENRGLDGGASIIRETLPQVLVVLLVCKITCIDGLSGDISAQDDCGEGLCLDRDASEGRVKDLCHKEGVLVGLSGLGAVQLVLSLLALHVVVGEDLLQNAADA